MVVHILLGCYLSIMTIPHCGLLDVYFITSSVFLIASRVVDPYPLNLPISWAATSVSVSLLNLTPCKYFFLISGCPPMIPLWTM